MGLAIRTKQPIDLAFPSLVWKQLVGQPLTRSDLFHVDTALCHSLDALESPSEGGSKFDLFSMQSYQPV